MNSNNKYPLVDSLIFVYHLNDHSEPLICRGPILDLKYRGLLSYYSYFLVLTPTFFLVSVT